MPFTLSDPKTIQLIQVLQRHPEGATLYQIAGGLDPVPPQRTLQYWLSKLVFAGQIKRRGGSKNTRYFAGSARCRPPVKKRQPKPAPVPLPVPQTPPSPPEPIEESSHLPPQYRRIFDQAAPKIIRMGYSDEVAIDELVHAFAAIYRHAETDEMNEFAALAMEELDDLDRDRTLAKYKLKRDDWDYWRPKWCRLRNLPAED